MSVLTLHASNTAQLRRLELQRIDTASNFMLHGLKLLPSNWQKDVDCDWRSCPAMGAVRRPGLRADSPRGRRCALAVGDLRGWLHMQARECLLLPVHTRASAAAAVWRRRVLGWCCELVQIILC